MNPIWVSSMHCAICSGFSMMFAPIAFRASAAPDFEETEPPPCFATRPPAAAITNIEVVEILNVRAPSPPVPTISSSDSGSLTFTFVERSRITFAAAVISPMVSFLTRSPTIRPAI